MHVAAVAAVVAVVVVVAVVAVRYWMMYVSFSPSWIPGTSILLV